MDGFPPQATVLEVDAPTRRYYPRKTDYALWVTFQMKQVSPTEKRKRTPRGGSTEAPALCTFLRMQDVGYWDAWPVPDQIVLLNLFNMACLIKAQLNCGAGTRCTLPANLIC